MKRICCFLLVALMLMSFVSCRFQTPEEALLENLSAFTPEFEIWTRDVTALFTKVLKQHPHLQVYIGKVKTSGSDFRQNVSVTYQHTDIKSESICVGKEQDVAVSALQTSLDAAWEQGVMVLLGQDEQPDPQVWLDTLAQEHYLSYMGLTDTSWTFYTNDFTEDTVVIWQAKYSMDIATLLHYRQQSETELQRLSIMLWDEQDDQQQRVLAIHDHLIESANYAEVDTPADHTPYNILLEGRGVCDGYAYAAKLLLDAADIENEIVTGTAAGGEHRWNLVKIGENWYHMDVTWDDPVSPDGREHHTYNYYLKGDAVMNIDHQWQGEYPICEKNYK